MLQAGKRGVDDAQYIRDADAEVEGLAEGPDAISAGDTGWVWNASSHLLCDDSCELRRGRKGIGGISASQTTCGNANAEIDLRGSERKVGTRA